MTDKLPTKEQYIAYVECIAGLCDTLYGCGMGELVREIMLPIAECLLSEVAERGQSSGAEHELDYYTDPSPWTIETVAAYWHQLWEGRK